MNLLIQRWERSGLGMVLTAREPLVIGWEFDWAMWRPGENYLSTSWVRYRVTRAVRNEGERGYTYEAEAVEWISPPAAPR